MDSNGFSICNTTAGTYADQRANARLIAAAPDLLAALLQIQRMGYADIGDRMMVDAAIAKAEGK